MKHDHQRRSRLFFLSTHRRPLFQNSTYKASGRCAFMSTHQNIRHEDDDDDDNQKKQTKTLVKYAAEHKNLPLL